MTRTSDGQADGAPAAGTPATGGAPADAPVHIIGAEATISETTFLGRPVLAKHRIAKGYRHPELDARLRAERTRDEAHLLVAARAAGVPVPIVHDIDRTAARILLEPIMGPALRQVLPRDDDGAAAGRLRTLGAMTARLHDAGLTHGDLTTSNVLVPDPADPSRLVLIDFGLGQFTREDEPRGVDLHLVEEALEATDARAPALMEAFLDGYRHAGCADPVLRRLEAIRLRGRYREAV